MKPLKIYNTKVQYTIKDRVWVSKIIIRKVMVRVYVVFVYIIIFVMIFHLYCNKQEINRQNQK